MSEWVNWQDFQRANEPEVTRANAAQEEAQAAAQAQMDAQLRDLSERAMDRADFGRFAGVEGLAGYGELMKRGQDEMRRQQSQEIGAPWEADLGRKSFDSPWAKLNERIGGAAQRAAQRNAKVQTEAARKQQEEQMRQWNAEQARQMDEAQNGQRRRDAAEYSRWSDAVQHQGQRTRGGGSGGGAWYDWAQGQKGAVAPTMAPSSPLTAKVNSYYAQNPSYRSSSNFGNPNNAGSIFTGNWSF